MSKGFATDNLITKKPKKKVISNEPQGRLISWSPYFLLFQGKDCRNYIEKHF